MKWKWQSTSGKRHRGVIGRAAAYWLAGWFIVVGTVSGADWISERFQLEPDTDARRAPVVSAVALHPEDELLAIAGDDHCVRILDLESRQVVRRLADHADWVRALAYSRTGEWLASAGGDGRILVWNGESGQKVAELPTLSYVIRAIAFSDDGSSLSAIGFGEKLHVFDIPSGHTQRELSCPCRDMRALAYSSDFRTLAGAGRNGIVRVWDAQDGQVLQEYAAHRQRVWGLAFSPDGQYLASCAEDGATRVSRLDGQDDFILQSPGTKVLSLAFCGPDQLATGGSDNRIRIWDLNRRKEIADLEGHTGSVVTLAYNGTVLISAGYDTTVRIWKRNNNLAEDPQLPPARVGSLRGANTEVP